MQNYAVLTRRSIKKKYNIYYRFYDPAMTANIVKNKHLIDKISITLQNHEFRPYYQPQYGCQDEKTDRGRSPYTVGTARWFVGDAGEIYSVVGNRRRHHVY